MTGGTLKKMSLKDDLIDRISKDCPGTLETLIETKRELDTVEQLVIQAIEKYCNVENPKTFNLWKSLLYSYGDDSDSPDLLMDPLTYELMTEPNRLIPSGNILDHQSVEQKRNG
jgi:hypothetical protein